MRSLSFEPVVPLALWLTLALAGAALLAWYGMSVRRRVSRAAARSMLALMGLSLALPLAILLNPTWTERLPPPAGKPLVTLLVDTSASMATRDVPRGSGSASRLEAAARFAQELAPKLESRYDVRLLAFDAATRGVELSQLASLAPNGALTNLAGALEQAADEDRSQGQFIVLASDGIHNAGGGSARVLEAADRARALAAPVYVLPLGGDASVRDLDVAFYAPQELAFVGQRLAVAARVSQQGLRGGKTQARLLLDQRELQQRSIELSAQRETDLAFDVVQDKPGLYRYDLQIDPLPGEVTPLNNRATLLVRVVDQPIRVLLLEGKPYWDTRFLLRTLLEDTSLELVSVVRMADRRLLEQTYRSEPANAAKGEKPAGQASPDAPKARSQQWKIVEKPAAVLAFPENLATYQIVILGRDADAFLDDGAVANLRTWLTRGGGSLVCFRGAPTTQASQQLNVLLPVRWSAGREARFHVQWTDRGKQMRWLSAAPDAIDADPLMQLPTLATSTPGEQPKPLAVVLATAPGANGAAGQPVITYQPAGSGRTVVIEGAGMWRWAFLPPQHEQHAAIYGELWRSLFRWLAAQTDLLPGQRRLLRADKVQFLADEPATATLLVRDEALAGKAISVELAAEGQTPRLIAATPAGGEIGAFRVAFGKLPAGRYRARVAGASDSDSAAATWFDVRPDLAEQLNVRARPDLLGEIARRSGGAVIESTSAGQFSQQIDEHLRRTRPERIQQFPAWDRWWILVGVCVIWTTTWATRRSRGLV